jgi:sigma-B regulation protein RsbQ
MNLQQRNNIHVLGSGSTTVVFAHGFGCDQNMWRFLTPVFADRYKVVLFDLVGSGRSDLSAYDTEKYSSLQGYADDLVEIIRETADSPIIFVGHSVSTMIGVLADIAAPELFALHIMVGPSPCYINDGDYIGGFTRADIESLLNALESNYLGWSSTMAPAIMGAPGKPELGEELTNSFCSTDPDIAAQFARVTFLSDNRADLPEVKTPALILQCSDDIIAPLSVGSYLHEALPNSVLRIVDNVGHCPHLSEPEACIREIRNFILDFDSALHARS